MGCETEYNFFTSELASYIDEIVVLSKRRIDQKNYSTAVKLLSEADGIAKLINDLNKEKLVQECHTLPGDECDNMLNLLHRELSIRATNETDERLKYIETYYSDQLLRSGYRNNLHQMCKLSQERLKSLI
jgi:hypothetical protein